MPADRQLDRRAFLADLGRGAFAVAIVSIAGCGPSLTASPTPAARGSAGPGPTPTRTPAVGPTAAPTAGASPGPSTGGGEGLRWQRVNLGFVSAYLLVRGGEAALVDTGVAGSEGQIEASLGVLGLGWSSVGHVILTHHHGDHAGSLGAVLSNAPDAAGYAGAEDIPSITAGRSLTAVGDGDGVFDLRIVTTPGHTAGSICVLDPAAGILVAGDALGTAAGAPTLPGAQFTQDMALARQSIVKLGGLAFETLLVGHGDPIEAGAAGLVAALGAAG